MALGFRVLAEADQLIAHVQQFPRTGTRLLEFDESGIELRAFVVSTVFPYTVFAAVFEHEIVVVAVAHQHQEPGYWAERPSTVAR